MVCTAVAIVLAFLFAVPGHVRASCENIANVNILGFGFDAGTCGGGVSLFGFRLGASNKGVQVGGNFGVGAGVGPVAANAGLRADINIGKEVSLAGSAYAGASAIAGVGGSLGGKIGADFKKAQLFWDASGGVGAGFRPSFEKDKSNAHNPDVSGGFLPDVARADLSFGCASKDGCTAGGTARFLDASSQEGRAFEV